MGLKDRLDNLVGRQALSLILGLAGAALILFGLVYPRLTQPRPEVTLEEGTVTTQEISVDIAGAVNQPGVYQFKSGARLSEAIAAAKGLSSKVDLSWVAKNLNLASKLSDEQKIYVPFQGEAVLGSSKTSTGLININTANATELDTLPGVGEVTAGKIIANRPYEKIEDLKTKKAVGNATFEKIKGLISVN